MSTSLIDRLQGKYLVNTMGNDDYQYMYVRRAWWAEDGERIGLEYYYAMRDRNEYDGRLVIDHCACSYYSAAELEDYLDRRTIWEITKEHFVTAVRGLILSTYNELDFVLNTLEQQENQQGVTQDARSIPQQEAERVRHQ